MSCNRACILWRSSGVHQQVSCEGCTGSSKEFQAGSKIDIKIIIVIIIIIIVVVVIIIMIMIIIIITTIITRRIITTTTIQSREHRLHCWSLQSYFLAPPTQKRLSQRARGCPTIPTASVGRGLQSQSQCGAQVRAALKGVNVGLLVTQYGIYA